MNFVLVVIVHVGALGNGNSNAITNIQGFKSRTSCEASASEIKTMMNGTVKDIVTRCVEVK